MKVALRRHPGVDHAERRFFGELTSVIRSSEHHANGLSARACAARDKRHSKARQATSLLRRSGAVEG
jgi:hypothetical protein